jgi:Trk K+ transport system NAD-binding subunit
MKKYTVRSLLLQQIRIKEKLKALLRFLFTLFFLIGLYSVTFHFIMVTEGRQFSWLTGVYWTLTTMTTLGFGDITFSSDLGRGFSVLVLMSGLVYLLILFPYVFFTFFYTPLMEYQAQSRIQKNAPEGMKSHVIIVGLDPIAESFIEKLNSYNINYLLMADTIQKTKDWKDMGYSVIHGYPDDPDSYRRALVDKSILVFANAENEKINTMISFTVRELNPDVEIVTNAFDPHFIDILFLAGCNQALDITSSLGKSFSSRAMAKNHLTGELGRFDKLVIWEVPSYGSKLVGLTIKETAQELSDFYLVGVWRRGEFLIPPLEETIAFDMILVVAGFEENAKKLDDLYLPDSFQNSFVLIIGGGRVGRATALYLQRLNVPFKILDYQPERKRKALQEGIKAEERFVIGDGSHIEDLEKAGIYQASTVIISTHEDSTNIFLTVYCRKLRKQVLILSRSNLERNISTLHRAGADLVISYASLGALQLLNFLRKSKNILLAEGLAIFRLPVPNYLKGKSIREANIRSKTGCSVIALCHGKDDIEALPPIEIPLPQSGDMILIGSPDAELKFMEEFVNL